jgi:hypothetical protein
MNRTHHKKIHDIRCINTDLTNRAVKFSPEQLEYY